MGQNHQTVPLRRRPLVKRLTRRGLGPLYGNLPLHKSGPNVGRIDRKATAARFGITVNDLFKAYWNWQEIFRFEGSELTFEQYLTKLQKAGLSPSDIGNRDGQFNLSRYNDEGPYSDKNCRFITRKDNLREQYGSMV
jgi:hypothetical protein